MNFRIMGLFGAKVRFSRGKRSQFPDIRAHAHRHGDCAADKPAPASGPRLSRRRVLLAKLRPHTGAAAKKSRRRATDSASGRHKVCDSSEYAQRDAGAGFGVGQGVVVVFEHVAARRGDRMQPMVRQPVSEDPARRTAGAEKTVVGPGQTPAFETGAQATLVEDGVVRHKRQMTYYFVQASPNSATSRHTAGNSGAAAVSAAVRPWIRVQNEL